jgi:photosystem II stability/assembly factor-like uncharacterized protein
MRNILLLACLLLICSLPGFAQIGQIPSPTEVAAAPSWAQLMYGPSPNVWAVDNAYRDHYRSHPYVKSYHTQYYKRWRRAANSHIQADGSIDWPTIQEKNAADAAYLRKLQSQASPARGTIWSAKGPFRVYNNNNTPEADHINIYSIAQCAGTPTVMFAGTEPGEIYRSGDGGETWANVSKNHLIDGGINAIAIDPNNGDIVLAASGSFLYRSTNGGGSWATVLNVGGLNAAELTFHPSNSNIALLASDRGTYRSTDGGLTFTQVAAAASYDVKFKPGNPNTVYLLQNNTSLVRAEFFTSTDIGQTWTLHDTGWYTSNDPARSVGGGRIAVTTADTNRVYAYLIGEAKANDVGYIGVFKSTDGGNSWSLPSGYTGGPYTTTHQNLAAGSATWAYHQGFYNCAIMASQTNADEILVGGLNLWRSTDGGANYASVAGYVGGPLNMHVDNQDFRNFNGTDFITTDGGIYKSTDFFQTQPEVKMDGIHAGDYWGFGSGWNEDVVTGGMYHNGNNAWREAYGPGNHIALGGGEAPTGYVNPGRNNVVLFSDIGGRILPNAIGQAVGGSPFGLSPNETYFSAESSELEFHPNCYSVAYLGRDHKLWRTDDGCASFSLVDSFGTNANSRVMYIEVSRSNPDIIYLSQQPASGNNGQIWKTTDAGGSWTSLPLPSGPNKRRMLLALDAEDPNVLFVAFPQGNNGNKIFRTTNGGTNWANLTTSLLDGENVHSIALIGGTDGGIYFCTERSVYYRENSMSNWVIYNQDLPIQYNSNIAKPFYRDGKIRIASYGKGIWEAELHTQPSRPIATAMVDVLSVTCASDSFHFEDHSMLNHAGASWAWTFQNGSPASSSQRNPAVAFAGMGQHMCTLTITDGNGQIDRDTIFVEVLAVTATSPTTDFEGQFPPNAYRSTSTGSLSWTQSSAAGGYGNSPSSAAADSYNVDAAGTWADLSALINLDTVQVTNLTFDVAYSQYGGQYSDTLEVLVSLDCGQTFTRLYRKGGQSLATAPNFTTAAFVPTASQWRTDTVDLSAYSGVSGVLIAFRSIGRFGQVMYLDNVNLNGSPIVGLPGGPQPTFAQLAPNPLASGQSLRLFAEGSDSYEVRIYSTQGKLVVQQFSSAGATVPTDKLSAGTYFWEVLGGTLIQRGKLIVLEGRN